MNLQTEIKDLVTQAAEANCPSQANQYANAAHTLASIQQMNPYTEKTREETLHALREAIQDAEAYGMVRHISGTVITGVMDGKHGFELS